MRRPKKKSPDQGVLAFLNFILWFLEYCISLCGFLLRPSRIPSLWLERLQVDHQGPQSRVDDEAGLSIAHMAGSSLAPYLISLQKPSRVMNGRAVFLVTHAAKREAQCGAFTMRATRGRRARCHQGSQSRARPSDIVHADKRGERTFSFRNRSLWTWVFEKTAARLGASWN
ncbi:uncharacterized protein F5Z01DRAFT_267166 [Emericellopsis atlantica]|uniref:Uncharacterized protein n=1 Tax=Emericellopsis atlantica TaxID=2614577 RepID=A0A9P7ZHI4_9HYPO|nr:uncharacterized protein F5Z01DRAFT_267166 [Emericellopsis atlantica]KAG9251792.1 hypothetical protein F5Z01DRAFT_267166 [Emericellopsis atlantica]